MEYCAGSGKLAIGDNMPNGQLGPEFVSGARTRTRDALNDRARRAAAGFKSLGVSAGGSVALLLRNEFVFFEATDGARALGAYAVPVNWHLAPAEIEFQLNDCGAAVLVGHADLLKTCAAIIPEHMTVIAVETPPELREAYRVDPDGGALAPGATDWESWLAGFDPLTEPAAAVPESMFYTSGTTGMPKAVKRLAQTPDDAAHMLAVRDKTYGIRSGCRALIAGPLYHGAPNAFGIRVSHQAGKVVMMPRFDAEQVLALIAEHRIEVAFLVPVMFVRMLKLPDNVRTKYDLSSLTQITTAGAPCPVEIKSRMIDWVGPVIHEFYASTEINYMTNCSSADAVAKPGTVGLPVDGAMLKIFGEDGSELPTGQPGEIYGRLQRGPDFTYHNREEARRAIERDGLVTAGDVGYFDEDGYMFLCDRQKDMVISGGVNIYPAEIEGELAAMPGVADCAVFGIPDAEFGEALMVVIELDSGAEISATDVRNFLSPRLAAFKVPRQIEFRGDLPRNDSGKIYKRRLRDPYWEGVERRI